MQILTSEQFREALKRYLQDENLSVNALARNLGKPRSTVKQWVQSGVSRDKDRLRIISEHPQIFGDEAAGEATLKAPAPVRKSAQVADTHALLVFIKTEQARSLLLNLRTTLVWFLFKASAVERNAFRDELGDEWSNFLELTRAMTNETAFEITKNEGRLDWCQP